MAWEQVKPTKEDERQNKAYELKVKGFFFHAHHCELCESYTQFIPILSDDEAVMCVSCSSTYPKKDFIELDKKYKPKFIQETALRLSDNSNEEGEWFYSG